MAMLLCMRFKRAQVSRLSKAAQTSTVRRMTHRIRLPVAALLALSSLTLPAQAQTVEEFYRGHQIQLVIGFPVANAYDTYGRAVARHLGKHIPGNPTVVPVNRPGAGSLN